MFTYVVVILFSLLSCTKNKNTNNDEEEIIFIPQTIKWNTSTENYYFVVSIYFLFRGAPPEIKFVTTHNNIVDSFFSSDEIRVLEVLDEAKSRIKDNEFETVVYKTAEHRGYKMAEYSSVFFSFGDTENNTQVNLPPKIEVQKIAFTVNGKLTDFELGTPVVETLLPKDTDEAKIDMTSLRGLAIDWGICLDITTPPHLRLLLEATCDLVIDEFLLNDFVKITYSEIYVDEVWYGSIEDMPFEIKQGEHVEISIEGEYLDEESIYTDVMLDSIIKYRIGNEHKYNYNSHTFQAVRSEEAIRTYIDYFLSINN